jgi:spore coat protein CotF
MEEKVMVADALKALNAQLGGYGSMIAQTENKELKQTLKQMRNQAEMSQEQLYTMAKEKGYYTPAQWANDDEILKVKNLFV